jgi:hypothetical protein
VAIAQPSAFDWRPTLSCTGSAAMTQVATEAKAAAMMRLSQFLRSEANMMRLRLRVKEPGAVRVG